MTRLRIPGPTPVPERVRQALSGQVLYHRSKAFSVLLEDAETLLMPLFGTTRRPFMLTSSGTGAMEAALLNTLAPGDHVVALDNGHWGRRFGRLAEAVGAVVQYVVSPWGGDVDVAGLSELLGSESGRGVRAVLLAHNDTFTGAVADVSAVGRLVRDTDCLLVVDAVSSLGTMPLEADAWGVDVVVSGSQKGLMSPPGLAFMTVSEKAWARIDALAPRSEYFDLRRVRAQAQKSQTVFTPAVNTLAAVDEALHMIHEEGLAEVFERQRRLAEALRAGVQGLGLDIFAQDPCHSPSVSVIRMPAGVSGSAVVAYVRERFGTIMTGARRSQLDGKVVRVSTMGWCHADDIRLDVWQLAQALNHFGYACSGGAAMDACEKVLEQGESA